MKLRYYIAFAILFCIALGGLVYSVNPSDFTLELGGLHATMPIAVWCVCIVVFFFLCTLLFLVNGTFWHFYAHYNEARDFEKLAHQILDQTTRHTFVPQNFHSPRWELLSRILGRFQLRAHLDTQASGYEKVDKLFALYEEITRQNWVDFKAYNLCAGHPFLVQNTRNKIQNNTKYALDIIRQPDAGAEMQHFALQQVLENGAPKDIQRLLAQTSVIFDVAALQSLLGLYLQKKVVLEMEAVAALCAQVGLGKENYLRLAREAKMLLLPDDWFKFFELLAEKDAQAEKAFLYVLLDLEMLDQAVERLKNHTNGDFLLVKAYLELKNHGGHYPLELFFALKEK